ncbi:molybdopterin-dependent oxidoreductase [Shimia haliotis]|uniref:Oxidoreductase molybdopterin-binding domain-containing protein n=1 Tax=Shimia haliotis TaxID=1280847 RepID=A0A1I4HLJ1_9RHOB|nr:molybdopterin-dependent oxidoreductase [Shimia haliotis]SFL42630.1 hypothetical protein SAMN04488036_11415 [Shimia haliotis]
MKSLNGILTKSPSRSLLAGVVFMAMVATQPMAETVLTITGDVAETADGAKWQLDENALRALPMTMLETDTIWTEGLQTFEGVSLAALLAHVGAGKGELRATAVNDYTVSIPTSDAVKGGPIVAYLRNGEKMSLRDKGPLWIVYPFAENASYQTEEYYSRSIWQLDRIEVVADE